VKIRTDRDRNFHGFAFYPNYGLMLVRQPGVCCVATPPKSGRARPSTTHAITHGFAGTTRAVFPAIAVPMASRKAVAGEMGAKAGNATGGSGPHNTRLEPI